MGMPAARLLDMHVCPLIDVLKPHVGGPITGCCPTVIIGGMPAARVTDLCVCVSPAPDMIALGSFTTMIGSMPAARMGDTTAHGGKIVMGCFTVFVG